MDLSIIIPAYNEHQKIERDILAASDYLMRQNFKGEIIIVDDGSSDETAETAIRIKNIAGVDKKVLSYKPNKGKGYAVREGIKLSKGKYVMFADSGVCIDYNFTSDGLKLLQSDQCEIAHGSRKMKASVIKRKQPFIRQIASKMFQLFIFTFMGIPRRLTDTQCGFKMYQGDVARELYGNAVTDGFSFDIEIILRAVKKKYRILEFPVVWFCDSDSRLSTVSTSGKIFNEFIKIKRAVK